MPLWTHTPTPPCPAIKEHAATLSTLLYLGHTAACFMLPKKKKLNTSETILSILYSVLYYTFFTTFYAVPHHAVADIQYICKYRTSISSLSLALFLALALSLIIMYIYKIIYIILRTWTSISSRLSSESDSFLSHSARRSDRTLIES